MTKITRRKAKETEISSQTVNKPVDFEPKVGDRAINE
jgi:hypothetical protein